jgi:hypothetical protein
MKKPKKQPKCNMHWASSANLVIFGMFAIDDNPLTKAFLLECVAELARRGHMELHVGTDKDPEILLPAEEQEKLDQHLAPLKTKKG